MQALAKGLAEDVVDTDPEAAADNSAASESWHDESGTSILEHPDEHTDVVIHAKDTSVIFPWEHALFGIVVLQWPSATTSSIRPGVGLTGQFTKTPPGMSKEMSAPVYSSDKSNYPTFDSNSLVRSQEM